MDTKNIRLREYLAKVDAQYEWDRFWQGDGTSPDISARPSLEKEERHAQAMGWGEEFELEAMTRRYELEDQEIKEVARVSPDAAAIYQSDIESLRDQALHRASYEFEHATIRSMKRWEQQERERYPERAERALARFGCWTLRTPWHERPPTMPEPAKGGFHEHAKRESALEQARQYVAVQRQSRD